MRFGLWAVALWMAFAQVATPVATPEASPVATEHKPYLSHSARFVTTIPSDWVPDRSLAYEYAGESGFIASRSLDALWNLPDQVETLEAACENVADVYGGEQSAMEVAGMSACLVEPAATGEDVPIHVVITHPEPHGVQEFVLLTTNRGPLHRVLATHSFDLADVSPMLYLDTALDLISMRSLQRDLIDWEALRADAHRQIANVSPEQGFQVAHEVLQQVIAEIVAAGGDAHNRYLRAEQVEGYGASINWPELPTVLTNAPAPGLLRVVVPQFLGTPEEGKRFVETLWSELEAAVDDTTCGIVVDLSVNAGGNMYPMLQGLGPLIGTGPLLGFTDAAGIRMSVEMGDQYQLAQDGVVISDYTPDQPAPDLGDRSLAIAVYIRSKTASSGEATAIGMMASDYPVRFFGAPTSGLATSGGGIFLMDGAILLYSSAWTTTVDGQTFPDGVDPDVEVDDSNMAAAVEEWFQESAGC